MKDYPLRFHPALGRDGQYWCIWFLPIYEASAGSVPVWRFGWPRSSPGLGWRACARHSTANYGMGLSCVRPFKEVPHV